MRVVLALSLTVSSGLVALSAGAAPSALVKVVQGPAYGFDNITAIASNGAHVWAVSTANNSVTELKSGSGAVISVLKDKKFDFEGPERLSDDWTHVWVANDAGNSITELNANTGKLIAVIKGSTYK